MINLLDKIFITVELPDDVLEKYNEEQLIHINKISWIMRNNYWDSTENFLLFIDQLYHKYSVDGVRWVIWIYENGPLINTRECCTFLDTLRFIEGKNGLYFAIDYHERKVRAYGINPPPRKHLKYIKKRCGLTMIFLSFADWNEYILKENELPLETEFYSYITMH